MILDTSFLLDLKDGHQEAFEKATEMYDAGIAQRVAMPTVWELHYGAVFSRSEDERRRVRNLLGMYPLVSIDKSIALRAGELLAEADRNAGGDSGVDNEDGVIAAVADLYGEPVLTDNVRHFERLPGIHIETY